MAVETGFTEKNSWLEWLMYTAQHNKPKKTDCLACAAARPNLGTVPFPLNPTNDQLGFQCMLQMFTSNEVVNNCTSLHYLFPPTATVTPLWFTPCEGNYTGQEMVLK